ncbi:MAG: UrcA family protein [Erythrobacter sp.]
MIKTAMTVAAALGLAAISTPALAGNADAPTMVVQFEDLDLNTAEGQEQLDKRIDDAAREVCGVDQVRTGTRIRSHEQMRCYDRARQSAANQIATLIEQRQRGG